MVVAVGPATVNGHTLFGVNRHGLSGGTLRLNLGRAFALGETVQTQHFQLPQARQTFAVLGNQPLNTWGYQHGINAHEVVAACAVWQSKLAAEQPGLTGTDLVRLVLERCLSARQGFDLLTGLVSRHGQCRSMGRSQGPGENDHIFLLADAKEAYIVEAAGSAWASLECRGVRAVSDVGLIRQDWQRLSPGLAEEAIKHGWWPDDGSKLDFGASLAAKGAGRESALRRWGRATLLLEEQNGHIDTSIFRRLLADHHEGNAEVDPLATRGSISLCRHVGPGQATATTASFIAELGRGPEQATMAWCAFGPPCAGVYLPLFLDGELPQGISRPEDPLSVDRRFQQVQMTMSRNSESWHRFRQSMAVLQARLDQQTEEFCVEAAALKRDQEHNLLSRQAGLFMQNHYELLEAELQRLGGLGNVARGRLEMELSLANGF
jgi:dipeptidase